MAIGTSVVTGRSAQMQGENKSQLFAPPASVKGPLATLDRTRFCPVLHPTARRCSWLQNELERTCFFFCRRSTPSLSIKHSVVSSLFSLTASQLVSWFPTLPLFTPFFIAARMVFLKRKSDRAAVLFDGFPLHWGLPPRRLSPWPTVRCDLVLPTSVTSACAPRPLVHRLPAALPSFCCRYSFPPRSWAACCSCPLQRSPFGQ